MSGRLRYVALGDSYTIGTALTRVIDRWPDRLVAARNDWVGKCIAPFKMWLRVKEKQISTQSELAAEKSAQYAQHMERFEARLRVLEQIVTDRGAETRSGPTPPGSSTTCSVCCRPTGS